MVMQQAEAGPKLPHIYLGLPAHDNRCHISTMMSIIQFITCRRWKTTISKVSSGGIHKARNNLAWEFLTKTDAEWYLSVDSDIEFHPDHVSRLLSRNVPIIGGAYCHKKRKVEWAARSINGIGPDMQTGLQKLCAIGTGFLLIHRSVFEKIIKNPDQPTLCAIEDWSHNKGGTVWDFFFEGIIQETGFFEQPTQLTEDWGFCYRARKAGFDIYADTTFYVKHWDGHNSYPEIDPPQVPLEAQPAQQLVEAAK
jgi:hypothetical protein